VIVKATINGLATELEVETGELLLDALRNAGYHGVKRGCETATCGSCVVLVDGTPKYSCALFAGMVEGRRITTIEGLGTPNAPHPLMEALVEEGGVQCGYCVPGIVLSAKALLDENPRPTEGEVREALDGHLCRCTGYGKQVKAVLKAADRLSGEGGTHG
jgi:carbon-monoxide dehydrogenase small subunit